MYKFSFIPDNKSMPTVEVVLEDDYAEIKDVISAFRQFLLGVTFSENSIVEFIEQNE